jgi:hypothetical protein
MSPDRSEIPPQLPTRIFTGSIGLRGVEVTLDSAAESVSWTGAAPRPAAELDVIRTRGREVTLVFNRGALRSKPEESVTFMCEDADEAVKGASLLSALAGVETQRHAETGFDHLWMRESSRSLADIRLQALKHLNDTLEGMRTASYEPALWFGDVHRLWTFEYCLKEELDHGGSMVEIMARQQGDLVSTRTGIPILLDWGVSVQSNEERLLRFMHVGRFHDVTTEGWVVVRAEPRAETLPPGETLLGFSRTEIVQVAGNCPLCNRAPAGSRKYGQLRPR